MAQMIYGRVQRACQRIGLNLAHRAKGTGQNKWHYEKYKNNDNSLENKGTQSQKVDKIGPKMDQPNRIEILGCRRAVISIATAADVPLMTDECAHQTLFFDDPVEIFRTYPGIAIPLQLK